MEPAGSAVRLTVALSVPPMNKGEFFRLIHDSCGISPYELKKYYSPTGSPKECTHARLNLARIIWLGDNGDVEVL
jgi:hypothetical protein